MLIATHLRRHTARNRGRLEAEKEDEVTVLGVVYIYNTTDKRKPTPKTQEKKFQRKKKELDRGKEKQNAPPLKFNTRDAGDEEVKRTPSPNVYLLNEGRRQSARPIKSTDEPTTRAR